MSTPGIGNNKPKINLNDVRKNSASNSNTNTTGLRQRAAGGLSNANRTSIFTRPLGKTGSSSIGGWVPAKRGFNPYDTQSALINRNANMRASANMYTGLNSGFGYATMGGVSYGNGNNAMNTLMGIQVGMQAAKSVFGMLNQLGVVGGNKTGGAKGPDTSGSIPTNTGDVGGEYSSVLANMHSANDSTTLRASIETAEGKLASLQASHSGMKADYDSATSGLQGKKDAISQAKKDLSDLRTTYNSKKSMVTKKESAVNIAKNEYGKATEQLNASQKDYAFAKQQRISAESAVETATNSFNLAESNYESAKNAYEACPQDSPQKAALEAKMQAAEQAKNTAKQKLEEANTVLEGAKRSEDTAKAAVEDGEQGVQDADEKMKGAEEALTNAEKELSEAKKAEEEAKVNVEKKEDEIKQFETELEEMEATIKDYEQGEKSIEKLSREIESEKGRLAKLVEQEQKAEADLDDKINRKQNRLDNRKSGGERLGSKISSLISEQDPIQRRNDITALLQKPGIETASGTLRSSVDRNGNAIFMLNNKEISQAEYNNILKTKTEEQT